MRLLDRIRYIVFSIYSSILCLFVLSKHPGGSKWLAHKVPGLNPAGGGIQLITIHLFIAQGLSLLPLHYLNMT